MNAHRTRHQPAAPGISWQLRPPDPGDGAALHTLIKNCPPLDPNSCYAYLLHGLHFADTCVLAEADGALAGYISAYRPPNRPDTLFVWQVAVAEPARGQGLAHAMLQELLLRPACRALHFLETTVSPGNLASTRLFQCLARALGCPCTISDLFPATLFGASGHDAERLFRLGPFPARQEHPLKEELHGHIHLRAP